jgi:hypothetical protein
VSIFTSEYHIVRLTRHHQSIVTTQPVKTSSGHRLQQNVYSSGDLMKAADLYNPLIKIKKRRMRPSAKAQHDLHVSSEDEGNNLSTTTMDRLTLSGILVFDILQPGRDERTYNNPLMDCSSMGECEFISCVAKTIHITFEDLDVLSAHDRLGDGNGLKAVHFQTEGDHRSLDLGFPASDDDRITDTRNHPQPDILDMQFPTMSDDEQSHDEMLELGFPPESDVEDVLDLGFDIDVSDSAGNTDGALEMGFDIDVSDPAGHTDGALEMGFDTNDIMPDDNPLEMGFDVDPAQFDPDQSCKHSCCFRYCTDC